MQQDYNWSMVNHGTYTAYCYGCRCDECTVAASNYHKARRANLKGTLSADDPRHGKYSTYVTYSCRCEDCKEAVRAYRAGKLAELQQNLPTAF